MLAMLYVAAKRVPALCHVPALCASPCPGASSAFFNTGRPDNSVQASHRLKLWTKISLCRTSLVSAVVSRGRNASTKSGFGKFGRPTNRHNKIMGIP
jgi:hypothetical protein